MNSLALWKALWMALKTMSTGVLLLLLLCTLGLMMQYHPVISLIGLAVFIFVGLFVVYYYDEKAKIPSSFKGPSRRM